MFILFAFFLSLSLNDVPHCCLYTFGCPFVGTSNVLPTTYTRIVHLFVFFWRIGEYVLACVCANVLYCVVVCRCVTNYYPIYFSLCSDVSLHGIYVYAVYICLKLFTKKSTHKHCRWVFLACRRTEALTFQ